MINFSCKKNSIITGSNAIVNFSTDTVSFDTVFVTTGSVTQSVKIYNANNQELILQSIKLMGGSQSPFRINIDGSNTLQQSNTEMDPGDSLYIFVSVYVNPNSSNLPFILEDSILVSFNGIQKFIQLRAYGQNAHFLNNLEISSTTVWQNDLPYVVLGGIQIDSGVSLTIQNGCKVYFHANAPMLVNGTLLANGLDSSRVLFTGDRLDVPYNSFPGSWPGIYFGNSSKDNVLGFAEIQNADQTIVVTGLPADANPKLSLNDCIINNAYTSGLSVIQSSVSAQNCLISNCGNNIILQYGGSYSFINCTVASYSNIYLSHNNPVLEISNSFDSVATLTADMSANFTNCIFWGSTGSVTNEVVSSNTGSNLFNIQFNHGLWRVQNIPAGVSSNNMNITDPLFDSLNNVAPYYNFHLQTGSPAIGTGIYTGIPIDLDGNSRVSASGTDLGCYEHP